MSRHDSLSSTTSSGFEEIVVFEEFEVPAAAHSPGSHDDDDHRSRRRHLHRHRKFADSDAQQQWEESLQQIQDLLTFIIVPVAGKFLGRRFAYYLWARFTAYRYNTATPQIKNEAAFAATGVVESAVTLSV